MIMYIQNMVKFCPFILRILSGNEILTSTEGYNSVANVQKIVVCNPNLDVINVNVYANFVKFYPLVLKILSGNEILTSIKGCHSAENLRKMTLYNPNIDLINCNVYTKFG